MRYSKVIVASGTVRTNALGLRHAVVIAVVLVGIAWAGVAFAQEGYLGHKLNQQVADIRKQNAVLAVQNQGYRKDVLGLTSGSAAEEEGRLNGYARPSEKLYLVTAIPTPSPGPTASASPSTR
jgi:hypothetical protein